MNERKIITISILGTSAFVIFITAIVLIIIYLRRRCKRQTSKTEQSSNHETTTTVEIGATNRGLDADRLVSATENRTPEQQPKSSTSNDLDPRVEQMLQDAYLDARQFVKFPNMP